MEVSSGIRGSLAKHGVPGREREIIHYQALHVRTWLANGLYRKNSFSKPFFIPLHVASTGASTFNSGLRLMDAERVFWLKLPYGISDVVK